MPKIKSSKLEIKEKRYNNFDIFCANFSLFWLGNKLFLAVQDSSIGDLVTHSLSESVSESVSESLLILVSSVFLTLTTVVFVSIAFLISH